MSRLLLATRNAGKLAEMREIVGDVAPGVEVIGTDDLSPEELYPEPVEDQPTFLGNALLKARAGLAATGLPTLADDSGLCVDALNGMPGVLSARWSGAGATDARNNQLLLDQLDDVTDERRGAHFVCAIALVLPGAGDGPAVERTVEGRMSGRVIREVRGAGGFGYDVLFEADDAPGRTTAELSREDKHAISHRGKALAAIAPYLAEMG